MTKQQTRKLHLLIYMAMHPAGTIGPFHRGILGGLLLSRDSVMSPWQDEMLSKLWQRYSGELSDATGALK